jgi:hypothetical protein
LSTFVEQTLQLNEITSLSKIWRPVDALFQLDLVLS